ncbi:MAG: helix-turn-helix domain-containing protein [Planctomycetaceae bacterium]
MSAAEWEQEHGRGTFACNGKYLAACRVRRGWTQEQAARIIGYTPRLIRKAEGGGRLRAGTIAILAEAYSTDEHPVFCEDIVCDPLALVRRYHDAYRTLETDMIDVIRHLTSDDVIFKMGEPGDPIPFNGIYHGHEGFARCWNTFFRTFSRPDKKFFQPRLLCFGQDVISVCPEKVYIDGLPETVNIVITMHFRIERGKIVFIEDLFDPEVGVNYLNAAKASGVVVPQPSCHESLHKRASRELDELLKKRRIPRFLSMDK